MKSWRTSLSVALLVTGLVALVWHLNGPDRTGDSVARDASAEDAGGIIGRATAGDPQSPSSNKGGSGIRKRIVQGLLELRGAGGSQERASAFLRLLNTLRHQKNRSAVVEAIIEVLDTGEDAQTDLPFAVGPGGNLNSAPTLRVGLLDLLGQLDREMAADYARGLMRSSSSPDEWAVGLRDLGRHLGRESAASDPDFPARVGELITKDSWLAEPTAGYLHALDTAVFLGHPDHARALAANIDRDFSRGVTFASRLALDRMVQQDFTRTARAIREDRNVLDAAPPLRAHLMARADIRRPEERALLEAYLLEQDFAPGELDAFTASFPNSNLEVSQNLMTSARYPMMDSVVAHDRAAVLVVNEWLRDARFAHLSDALRIVDERLREYLASASR